MDALGQYVVEWSPTERLFHIRSLRLALSSNRSAMHEGRLVDRVLVALSDSEDEAFAAAQELSKTGGNDGTFG